MFNQKPDELETPQDTGRLSKKVQKRMDSFK